MASRKELQYRIKPANYIELRTLGVRMREFTGSFDYYVSRGYKAEALNAWKEDVKNIRNDVYNVSKSMFSSELSTKRSFVLLDQVAYQLQEIHLKCHTEMCKDDPRFNKVHEVLECLKSYIEKVIERAKK